MWGDAMQAWIWVVIGVAVIAGVLLTLRKTPSDAPKSQANSGSSKEQELNVMSTPEHQDQQGTDPGTAGVQEVSTPGSYSRPEAYQRREPTLASFTATRGAGDAQGAGDGQSQWIEHWHAVQAQFVEDPQGALQRGDEIVQKVIDSLEDRRTSLRRSMDQAADLESRRAALLGQRDFIFELASATRTD
jgi:hypothetical protein